MFGRAVDKLFNGSRINLHEQFILEAKLEFVSRQHKIQNKAEGVTSHIFQTWSKLDCSLLFFS